MAVSRWTAALAGAALLLVLSPTAARAGEVDVDLRGGFYVDDAEGPFVGIGVLTGIGGTGRWSFNPNVEFAFGDNVDVISVSADFLYDLRSQSSPTFWVGGGPALVRYDPDFGRGSDTEIGLNGILRLGWTSSRLRPFFQLKVTVADESELAVGGGIRF